MPSAEYINKWRARRRRDAIAKLGGACARCGSVDALEFDHIDPSTKIAAISNLWTASRQRFDAELAKCQLLCEGCHLEKTSKERAMKPTVTPLHGSLSRYQRHGCRCDSCRAAYSDWKKKYRARKAAELREAVTS